MTAHNLRVSDIIKALKKMKYEFVDCKIEDELTLAFAPSEYQGDDDEEERGEIDIKDTII